MGKNMKHIPYFQGEAVLLCKDYKPNYLLDTHSKLFGKFQDDLFSKEKEYLVPTILVRITVTSISIS